MQKEIDAAADRLAKAQSVLTGNMSDEQREALTMDYQPREEIVAATTDLLVIGVRALVRIAAAAERHNEATAVLAARRFNIDHL